MKTKIVLFVGILSFALNSISQNSLPTSICSEFKPSGWIYFQPNAINFGELFTSHKTCFFSQPEDSMEVIRQWDDNIMNFHHIRYQQTYQGIEVEGCEFIEHGRNENGLVYANGKICPDIHKRYVEKTITEEEALDAILEANPFVQFAWESPAWESSLQNDLGDPSATYYPEGELVFGLMNYTNIQYLMDPLDYTLTWRFVIKGIAPAFECEVYVDAVTGAIVRVYNTERQDGPANVSGYGVQTLDTRSRGWPNNDFVLDTDNGDRNVHTKIDGGGPWALTAEVDDDDDDWGSTQQVATAPHWMVSMAWDYFTTIHGREGMHNFNVVRVRCDENSVYGAVYQNSWTFDIIKIGYLDGGVYAVDLEILAHEFSHGVNEHEGKLKYEFESGALDESFADIFGFLTRRWVTGSESWHLGVPGSMNRDQRSMQFPKTLGFHLEFDGTFVNEFPGQPDTYGGEFFYDLPYGNDAGGVHVNSGIQNHWFYMLSFGESDVNDLGDSYTINGIGIDKAAAITYYNFTNNMEKNSQYIDAAEGAIETALLLYGECSFEHIETQNAWYAAGVGDETSCANAKIVENEVNFSTYPNPATNILMISFDNQENRTIQLYSANGQLLKTINDVNDIEYVLDVSNLASGTYVINIKGSVNNWTKFIKQ
ncbi:MAG: M4 family metallopeptidase [Crocinitomicaceae bacterium]